MGETPKRLRERARAVLAEKEAEAERENRLRRELAARRAQTRRRDEALALVRPPSWCRDRERAKCLVVTSAQNNTPLFEPFWRALKAYTEDRGAQLIAIPVRYRNPTAPVQEARSVSSEWWPDELVPHLFDNDLQLHPLLRVLGHVRIGATAEDPLSGMETLSGAASALFGHGQLSLRTIATPHHALPKLLYTTGSVSERNYSRSKMGAKGEFRHTHSAIVVEKRQGLFHLRALVADEAGGFYDLGRYYGPEGAGEIERVLALVMGDAHAAFHDRGNHRALLRLIGVSRPRVIAWHDSFDAYSCSLWHRGDARKAYATARGGLTVERELELTARLFLKITGAAEVAGGDVESVVVPSNHDDFLLRWLLAGEQHVAPEDLAIYHELKAELVRASRLTRRGTESIDPFVSWCQRRLEGDPRFYFLARNESYTVRDIELGLHGHRGPSGARGTPRNLSRIGVRSMIGHHHAPGIFGWLWVVGTSGPLDPDYAEGPSAMLHTHGLIHPNGQCQLVHVIKGRY